MSGHIVIQLLVVAFPLGLGHLEGFFESFGHASQVPGIDMDSIAQTCRRSRKFGQDQRTAILFLADDVFQTGRVHSITDTGDQTDVGHPKEGKIFLGRKVLRIMLDWRVVEVAILAVDPGNEVGNLELHLVGTIDLVLQDAGWAGDLDKNHLFSPLGIPFQEHLKGHEFLGHAPDGIESITPDNDLLAGIELPQSGHVLFNDRILESLPLDGSNVDADGEDVDGDVGAVSIHSRRTGLEAKDAFAARVEMSGKAKGLKADHGGAERAGQDFFSPGETAHILAARKGDVEEEADINVGYALTKHAWQEHKMVVMDPNDIARLIDVQDAIGKGLIHEHVVGPRDLFGSSVIWAMLAIVKEGVEFMLGIFPPAALVLEQHVTVFAIWSVAEEDWQDPASRLGGQDFLYSVPVGAGDEQVIRVLITRGLVATIDRVRSS